MTDWGEIRRLGKHAEALLKDEAFVLTVSKMEESVLEQWRNSPARDEEGREKLWVTLKLLDVIKTTIQTMVEDGRIADASLRQLDEGENG